MINRKNRTNKQKPSNFPELTQKRQREHTLAVGRNYQHTAKFWDYYPFNWRHTRPSNAGFFVPVSCVTFCGYLPGVRGLQDGTNRNKRVVYQLGDSSTRQFLPTTKTLTGNQAMTATQSMGNCAQNPSAQSNPISPDRHRAAEHIADELDLTQAFIQAAADAVQLLGVPELSHVRQILQFSAEKLWENTQRAKALQVDLHQEFMANNGGLA